MRTVRAKLVVESVTETRWDKKVQFQAEYDPSIPEDQRFEEATPSASASFTLTNPELDGVFEPGRAFYVDFTPADESAE